MRHPRPCGKLCSWKKLGGVCSRWRARGGGRGRPPRRPGRARSPVAKALRSEPFHLPKAKNPRFAAPHLFCQCSRTAVGLSEGRWPQGKCRSYGAKNQRRGVSTNITPLTGWAKRRPRESAGFAGYNRRRHSRPNQAMSHRKTCRDRATHHRGFPGAFGTIPFSHVSRPSVCLHSHHTRYQADKVSEPNDLPAAYRTRSSFLTLR